MRRLIRRGLAVAVVGLIVCVGGASAAPTVIPLGDYARFAVSSEHTAEDSGQVDVVFDRDIAIEAGDRGRHGVDVVRRAPGVAPVRLARLLDAAGGGNERVVDLAISSTRWIVAIRTVRVAGYERPDEGAHYGRGDLVVTGGVDGGPVRVLARCSYREREFYGLGLSVAASGETVAFSGSSCPGAQGIRLIAADGAMREIAVRGGVLALSPRLLVTDESLVDLATGASVRMRLPRRTAIFGLPMLADDSTIVLPAEYAERTGLEVVRITPDGSPALVVRGTGWVESAELDPLVAGGGRVAFVHDGRLDAVALATGQRTFAAGDNEPLLRPTDAPVAVDASRAAWTTSDCAGRTQLVLDTTTATPPPERGSSAPCPMRFADKRLRARNGKLAVRVSCPVGCAGYVALEAKSKTERRAIAEETHISLAPGRTATLRFALDRAGRRMLRDGPFDAWLAETQLPDHPPWLSPTPPFKVRVLPG